MNEAALVIVYPFSVTKEEKGGRGRTAEARKEKGMTEGSC
jgi:hypothetical protein